MREGVIVKKREKWEGVIVKKREKREGAIVKKREGVIVKKREKREGVIVKQQEIRILHCSNWQARVHPLHTAQSFHICGFGPECDEYIGIFKYICHKYLFTHSFI